jgi:hypothetical protein
MIALQSNSSTQNRLIWNSGIPTLAVQSGCCVHCPFFFFSETPFGVVMTAITEPGRSVRYGSFQFGPRSGNIFCIAIIHCRIIVHQIIFFWLGIHGIKFCDRHDCKWAGSLSSQGWHRIFWLEIYLSVYQGTISCFLLVAGER